MKSPRKIGGGAVEQGNGVTDAQHNKRALGAVICEGGKLGFLHEFFIGTLEASN